MKIALFPGSFDPITIGHEEIIRRGLALFDEIIVATGVNSQKNYLFTPEQRLKMLDMVFGEEPRIRPMLFNDLTVNFARETGARFILRGLRTPQDFNYEQPIEFVNKHMAPELEIIHLISSPETAHISSTVVREVIKYKGKIDGLLPAPILDLVRELQHY